MVNLIFLNFLFLELILTDNYLIHICFIGNTIHYLNMPIGGMYVHSQSNDRNVRCWNLIEPWTKTFYDVDGTSNNGLLGFVQSSSSSSSLKEELNETIITSTDAGINLRKIEKGGYSSLNIKKETNTDSSTSTSSRSRSNKSDTNSFTQASAIHTTEDTIAVGLSSDGTIYTNYNTIQLKPILKLRITDGIQPCLALTECSYNGISKPVIAMSDNRGIGGTYNILLLLSCFNSDTY